MNAKIETFEDSMDDEALDRSTELVGTIGTGGGKTVGTVGCVCEIGE